MNREYPESFTCFCLCERFWIAMYMNFVFLSSLFTLNTVSPTRMCNSSCHLSPCRPIVLATRLTRLSSRSTLGLLFLFFYKCRSCGLNQSSLVSPRAQVFATPFPVCWSTPVLATHSLNDFSCIGSADSDEWRECRLIRWKTLSIKW